MSSWEITDAIVPRPNKAHIITQLTDIYVSLVTQTYTDVKLKPISKLQIIILTRITAGLRTPYTPTGFSHYEMSHKIIRYHKCTI